MPLIVALLRLLAEALCSGLRIVLMELLGSQLRLVLRGVPSVHDNSPDDFGRAAVSVSSALSSSMVASTVGGAIPFACGRSSKTCEDSIPEMKK